MAEANLNGANFILSSPCVPGNLLGPIMHKKELNWDSSVVFKENFVSIEEWIGNYQGTASTFFIDFCSAQKLKDDIGCPFSTFPFIAFFPQQIPMGQQQQWLRQESGYSSSSRNCEQFPLDGAPDKAGLINDILPLKIGFFG